MPSQNVESVQEFFDALNRGDIKAALDGLGFSDDFEVDFSRSVSPDQTGVYHGREEAEKFLERAAEPWAKMEWFADEYVEIGQDVIRVGGMRASGDSSGIEVVAKGAQVWEFRDGRAVAMRQCQSKEQALEVAGGE